MGHIRDHEMQFRGVTYNKFTSQQVRDVMFKKVKQINEKIDERKKRIDLVLQSNKITSEDLSNITVQYMLDKERGVQRMSYSNALGGNERATQAREEAIIPAGVIAQLMTERQLIEQEQRDVEKLDLVRAHVTDNERAFSPSTGETITRVPIHTLTDEEMTYLGI